MSSPPQKESPYQLTPILHITSASASVSWYSQLGFHQNWIHRFQPDFPAFVEISNGGMKIFLSEHKGDARPDTLLFLKVPNVDDFVKGLEGVMVEDNVELRMRECEVKDPDGNRLRIGTLIGEATGGEEEKKE